MSEQQAVVESQPTLEAPVMDVSRGPLVDITPEQRTEFRRTGNLPTKEAPKTEEAAPSSEAKPVEAEAKPAGDSEPPKVQEPPKAKPKQTAEERIAQLEATIEKIRKGAGVEKPKADSEPAKPEPKPVAADKEPTPDDTNADGTPRFKTYEEFSKALARWEVKQELAEQRRIDAEQAQANNFNAKLEEARGRYEDFDEKASPLAVTLNTDTKINPVIRQMFLDSPVLSDLLYTIGNDEAESAKFLTMAKETPRKAIEYVVLTESLIKEELEGKKTPTEVAPVKPKTQAPKPPSEAGGRAAAPPDALEAAAKANDFRSFKAEATRRQLAKLKT